MPEPKHPSPLTRTEVVDLYFLEHRAKVLDLAAFLDRCDRARDDAGREDFRIKAIRDAIALLDDGRSDRTARILELMSDHSTEPVDQAGMKGACGTPPPEDE
tara:strand:- start:151 stop:456 length:306 start_codon:yes stop_codon:yes gene_type:complete